MAKDMLSIPEIVQELQSHLKEAPKLFFDILLTIHILFKSQIIFVYSTLYYSYGLIPSSQNTLSR